MELTFDNRFLRELPGDPEPRTFIRQVEGAAWSKVSPTPVRAPRLLAHSREMADRLGFRAEDVASDVFAEVFAGNRLLPGMAPFASNYGGHQFGHWAGQLGDGRAISLGEAVNADGERWELQLRAPARRRIRGAPTGVPCCARRSASSCAARPCTTSVSPPRVR